MSCCSLLKVDGLLSVAKIRDHQELPNAFNLRITTNISGQPVSLVPISNKKVVKGTFVKTPLQLTACTNVCLRCITKLLAQCCRTVLAKVPIQHPVHTISHQTHLYLRNATAHLGVLVTGIVTAWKEGILAKLRAMPTPYDTRRRFASCMTSDMHYLVQMGRSGWMVFGNVSRSFLCRCCVLG